MLKKSSNLNADGSSFKEFIIPSSLTLPLLVSCAAERRKKKTFLTNSYGICMFCVFFNLRSVLQPIATVHLLSKGLQ